jgi:hypothetical protein
MDSYIASIAHVSRLGTAAVSYRSDEDGYYATHQFGLAPEWITRLAAALRRPVRRPTQEPAAPIATQMA